MPTDVQLAKALLKKRAQPDGAGPLFLAGWVNPKVPDAPHANGRDVPTAGVPTDVSHWEALPDHTVMLRQSVRSANQERVRNLCAGVLRNLGVMNEPLTDGHRIQAKEQVVFLVDANPVVRQCVDDGKVPLSRLAVITLSNDVAYIDQRGSGTLADTNVTILLRSKRD